MWRIPYNFAIIARSVSNSYLPIYTYVVQGALKKLTLFFNFKNVFNTEKVYIFCLRFMIFHNLKEVSLTKKAVT